MVQFVLVEVKKEYNYLTWRFSLEEYTSDTLLLIVPMQETRLTSWFPIHITVYKTTTGNWLMVVIWGDGWVSNFLDRTISSVRIDKEKCPVAVDLDLRRSKSC